MNEKRNPFDDIPFDELAKISMGMHHLSKKLERLTLPRKTAPQMLQDLLSKPAVDKSNQHPMTQEEVDRELGGLIEWFEADLRRSSERKLWKDENNVGRQPCADCGRCVCDKCIDYMRESKIHCEQCNRFAPEAQAPTGDVWDIARTYYKTVHEKAIDKMDADREFARLVNEKFENEQSLKQALLEYENALMAVENAKEKIERTKNHAALVMQRLHEAEAKKAKAHDEYEYINNNPPKK